MKQIAPSGRPAWSFMLLVAWLVSCPTALLGADSISVMTFNLWGAGGNNNTPLTQTLEAIRAADADLIGLQETRAESRPCTELYCPPRGESVAAAIAAELGYHLYQQQPANAALWANAILSRYPIVGHSEHRLGVQLDVAGRSVYLFNIHPADYPYQPYQLLRIRYGAAPFVDDAAAAIRYARRTRGSALRLLQQDLAAARAADLVVITGDFNEPSHRDWTPATVAAGLQPMTVSWPLTRALEDAGFIDGYRTVYPDAVARPGFTWSPLLDPADHDDHPDRIDFVFIRGANVTAHQAAVLGEDARHADIVVSPWPSDHRAVVVRLTF